MADADANLEQHLKKCRWVRINWSWTKIGRVNLGIFLRFNPLVTLLSAAIIWGFVTWCIVKSEAANEEMGKWKIWITEKFTWMYIGTQDIWAVIIIMLYFSKHSNMKLGRDDEEPEFNDATYFTMLFAAGIGIGLFYFGVGKLAFLARKRCRQKFTTSASSRKLSLASLHPQSTPNYQFNYRAACSRFFFFFPIQPMQTITNRVFKSLFAQRFSVIPTF